MLRMITGAAAAVLLAGCAAQPGDAAGAAPTAAAARPALCDTAQPARQQPFPFNKDAKLRDETIGAGRGGGIPGYTGGIATFEDLSAAELAWLIDERFIDPYETQNASPSAWEIFQFLCAHAGVRAAGYVVSIDRPDYRTSLEDISSPSIDAALRKDAEPFCADADETTFDDRLECFWD
ncbi:MAG TPA: hypothetical protein VL738_30680 [Dactylosporangium sp.]|nr:hypothetical protein [Dactylosporangium sp.]